jgi:M6 family metalloprotease-like protein
MVACVALGSAAPARATIVWQGREVPAWPDLPAPPVVAYKALQAAASGIHLFPHPSGVVRGLTILVDFSDQESSYSKEEVEAWLNTQGYAKFGLKGSIRDYFLKQSNGIIDYQNEVHGFYRAKQPKSYYQGGSAYERADELWTEVVAALDAQIDFSLFDSDKDGKVDAISLLYAGDEGTFGKGLWPHASSSNDMRDSVRLSRYMMTALNNQPINYVFAHESGHMLFGWPDLYGVGDYCIMANRVSDASPVGINDAYRADQGWIELVDVDSSTNARYTSVPDGVAYRFSNSARSTEYFLWSNVQNTDEWTPLKGGGLLIWHFDKSISSNEPPATLQLAVVQAAGSRQLGATTWPSPGSAATDLYSEKVNPELSSTTQPKSSWNNGSASGLRLYDITASGPSMQFSVGTGPLPSGGGMGGNASGGMSSGGAGGKALSGGSAGMVGGAGGKASGGGGSAGATGRGGASTGGVSSGGSAGAGGRTTSTGGSTTANGGGIASGGVTVGGVAAGGGAATGATDAMAGTLGTSGGASGRVRAEDGCSCRTVANRRASAAWSPLMLLSFLALRMKRRRLGPSTERS